MAFFDAIVESCSADQLHNSRRPREVSMSIACKSKSVVAFVAAQGSEEFFPFLKALAQANEVELVLWDTNAPTPVSGIFSIIMPGGKEQQLGLPSNLPSFQVEIVPSTEAGYEVKFSETSVLSPMLRGRTITIDDAAPAKGNQSDGDVLAKVNGHPVWKTRVQNGARQDISLQASPWIMGRDRVFEHLKGRRLMRLLPLIEWFRWVSGWAQWKKPKIRACFMFDDPNLHAARYGYISFDKLAQEGRRHHYHTSFATIPMDHYYVNKTAAQIVRDHPDELSLLVHGNDHIYRELDRNESPESRAARLHQALIRISRLERRSGLTVDRVMVAPHNAFGTKMMRTCSALGFEAGCVSWEAVWSRNRDQGWIRLLGAESGIVIEGLPIIPRIGLAPGTESQILSSAYLGQPIIPIGHHGDLREGLDLLASLAGFINGLGDVLWQNMATIARGNYWWRRESDTLLVRPFSRFFELTVPEDIRQVEVAAEWLKDDLSVSAQCAEAIARHLQCERAANGTWVIPLGGPCHLSVKINAPLEGPPLGFAPRRFAVISFLRRLLTETRDRLMPVVPRWLQKGLL